MPKMVVSGDGRRSGMSIDEMRLVDMGESKGVAVRRNMLDDEGASCYEASGSSKCRTFFPSLSFSFVSFFWKRYSLLLV